MKILAISGSARQLSTNTALLRAMQVIAPTGIIVEVFDGTGDLPVFSPDLEGSEEPDNVRLFKQAISESDGIAIARGLRFLLSKSNCRWPGVPTVIVV